MDKEDFENCRYKDTCKKYISGSGCPANDPDAEQFCMKLFKIEKLQDEALLTEKQREPIEMILDKQKTDIDGYRRLYEINDNIEDFVEKGKNLYIYSPITGNGKAQPDDSIILTPKGYVKIKDIQVGDEIFGEDGEIHHVTGKFDRGKRTTYSVEFLDGAHTRCCIDHLWNIQEDAEEGYKTVSLRDIIDKYGTGYLYRQNIQIPVTEPLNLPKSDFTEEEKDFSPFDVGCRMGLYGDAVNFVTVDEYLVDIDLHDYVYSDVDDRIAFLQGVMDQRGTVSGEGDSYFLEEITKSLYDKVAFIIESLGGIITHVCRSVNSYHDAFTDEPYGLSEERYSCFFTLPPDIIPFRKQSKVDLAVNSNIPTPYRIMIAINDKKKEHCYCISTDNPTQLYLTNNCIVTHNTHWSLKLMQSYFDKIWYKSDISCRALFINVPKFLLGLKDNIEKRVDYIEHIKENVYKADLVVWDDIATKSLTVFETEHLLSIIGDRIDSGKANIYTSNLEGSDLKKALGDRLYSRVFSESEVIGFYSRDKRGILG